MPTDSQNIFSPRRIAQLVSALFSCSALVCPSIILGAPHKLENPLKLNLEDLLNVQIRVASRFTEDKLKLNSAVSSVSAAQWESQANNPLMPR